MNWAVFLVTLWLLLGLELALKPALALGPTGVAPALVLPLVVFVAMHAPGVTALWAAVIAGVLLDLTYPLPIVGGGEVRVPGPGAIGMVLAATLVLNIRAMLIKRNPLTMLAMSAAGGVVAALVVVALLTLRAMYGDPIAWGAGRELGTRLGSALYTGVAGLIESLVFFPMAALFGFTSHHASQRRFTGR